MKHDLVQLQSYKNQQMAVSQRQPFQRYPRNDLQPCDMHCTLSPKLELFQKSQNTIKKKKQIPSLIFISPLVPN